MRSKDVDVEVFGLDVARLESLLAGFGKVHAIGRAFGVFRVGDSGARVLVTDAGRRDLIESIRPDLDERRSSSG